MSLRPYRDICRRKCRQVMVGNVPVGGGAPITVQSMTTTPTHDVEATVTQIKALERAGADIVRVFYRQVLQIEVFFLTKE